MDYAKGIALKLSYKFGQGMLDRDDVIQLAYQGLVMAAKRFDPSRYDGRGTPESFFKTYSYPRIVGSIIDECRKTTFQRRRGLEKDLYFQMLSLDMAGEYEDGNPWLKELGSVHPSDLVDFRKAMEKLTEREKRIIVGLAIGETGREIGQELGVSESRISQIATEAKSKLVECLAE